MPKTSQSWSKPKDLQGIIARKKVDWSIFEYGIHIPLEYHKYFEEANGNFHLERGSSHELILIIDGKEYNASLININQKDTDREVLQIRYDSNKGLKQYVTECFKKSYKYIQSEKAKAGDKKISVVIPDEEAEYIDIYETGEPFKYKIVMGENLTEDTIDEGNLQATGLKIWWVNQGTSINKAKAEGCLWAPMKSQDGKSIYHWDTMEELQEGDIVLHYANGALRYISKVIAPAIESPIPESLKSNNWGNIGRLVRAEYHELFPVIPLSKISQELKNLFIYQGPIALNGEVKQDYLFRFNEEALNVIIKSQPETKWPNFVGLISKFTVKQGMDMLAVLQDMASLQPAYSINQCSQDTSINEDTLRTWVRAIVRKGQAILYGPPGTGKTFSAKHLAKLLVAEGHGLTEIVQFHSAYAYEDFIQGIRPQVVNNILTYPVVPGRFLEFCKEAQKRDGISVLIIDEINRANLSRVFGELMYLLEYRDQKIPLAGGGEFSIPPNVRIIGTMNTADRSIALVDHALRRRFAFLALKPNFEVLSKFHRESDFPIDKLIEILKLLNKNIGDEHYEIGISFFIRNDLSEQIQDIWQMEIEPYIEEYFFDQPNRVNEFRWDKVKEKLSL